MNTKRHKNDIKIFKLACVSFAIGTTTQYKTILSLSLGAKSSYISHSSVNITKCTPFSKTKKGKIKKVCDEREFISLYRSISIASKECMVQI
jgi:hypothetical protein